MKEVEKPKEGCDGAIVYAETEEVLSFSVTLGVSMAGCSVTSKEIAKDIVSAINFLDHEGLSTYKYKNVCAESEVTRNNDLQSDQAAGWRACTVTEIRDYYCEGLWGNRMDGITPERGVWVTRTELGPPERIL